MGVGLNILTPFVYISDCKTHGVGAVVVYNAENNEFYFMLTNSGLQVS